MPPLRVSPSFPSVKKPAYPSVFIRVHPWFKICTHLLRSAHTPTLCGRNAAPPQFPCKALRAYTHTGRMNSPLRMDPSFPSFPSVIKLRCLTDPCSSVSIRGSKSARTCCAPRLDTQRMHGRSLPAVKWAFPKFGNGFLPASELRKRFSSSDLHLFATKKPPRDDPERQFCGMARAAAYWQASHSPPLSMASRLQASFCASV